MRIPLCVFITLIWMNIFTIQFVNLKEFNNAICKKFKIAIPIESLNNQSVMIFFFYVRFEVFSALFFSFTCNIRNEKVRKIRLRNFYNILFNLTWTRLVWYFKFPRNIKFSLKNENFHQSVASNNEHYSSWVILWVIKKVFFNARYSALDRN